MVAVLVLEEDWGRLKGGRRRAAPVHPDTQVYSSFAAAPCIGGVPARDVPFHTGQRHALALPYGINRNVRANLSVAPVLPCLCNCPDRASATRIARDLVQRRLAACVNLGRQA
ncbi:divalent cation tolerance protein CutA [Luteimonas qiangzhengi]